MANLPPIRGLPAASTKGLLPEIEAALKIAGGPVGVTLSPTDAGERAGQRGLRKSCDSVLSKVDPSHPVSSHRRAILSLVATYG